MPGLTLGYLSIADAEPVQLIQAAAAAGFTSAGLRITGRRPGEQFKPNIVGDRAESTRIRQCLADHGIRLSNISTYHLYPGTSVEDLLPVMEASAALGADYIVAASYDHEMSRMTELLGRYGEAAARFGLRIALEPVSYSAAATLAQAYALVQAAGQSNLGLMLDPLHLARAGDQPDALVTIDRERIFYAQICDARSQRPDGMEAAEEARTLRQYPGEGELPLADFLRALPTGIELEVEVPASEHRHLDVATRASLLHEKVVAYLSRIGMPRAQSWRSP